MQAPETKKRIFTIVYHEVQTALCLSDTAYAIVFQIHRIGANHDLKGGWVRYSRRKIAKLLGKNLSTVKRAIDELIRKKLIEEDSSFQMRSAKRWKSWMSKMEDPDFEMDEDDLKEEWVQKAPVQKVEKDGCKKHPETGAKSTGGGAISIPNNEFNKEHGKETIYTRAAEKKIEAPQNIFKTEHSSLHEKNKTPPTPSYLQNRNVSSTDHPNRVYGAHCRGELMLTYDEACEKMLTDNDALLTTKEFTGSEASHVALISEFKSQCRTAKKSDNIAGFNSFFYNWLKLKKEKGKLASSQPPKLGFPHVVRESNYSNKIEFEQFVAEATKQLGGKQPQIIYANR